MELYKLILFIYPAILTIAGFCSMGIDKKRARRNEWRVKERTLFLIAAFGGSVGSILGMYVFRHKTKHMSFIIGMPLILILQVIGIILLVILQ